VSTRSPTTDRPPRAAAAALRATASPAAPPARDLRDGDAHEGRPGDGAPHDGASSPLRADLASPVRVVRPGTVAYLDAWDLQRRLVERRTAGGDDVLLLLEHPAVYTMGKRTDRANLLWDEPTRVAHGIDLVAVDRGGDVTYHGPGQLVGYPILALASIRSVVAYVRALEETLIRALANFGIRAGRIEDYTGVWVEDAKIAAIGVRVGSGAITSHGFALNVHPDLDDFRGIVPCGIADRPVCSMASLGVRTTVDEVADAVAAAFAEYFEATLEPADLASLDLADATLPGYTDRSTRVPDTSEGPS
jgi:lipoyl(octanoyl) transferase